uniref:F-box associated domain-containing protein n=1 Tax=Ditylenchus dipsaci TaxID=166011 RepID=A0A915D6V9_9BILA
MSLKEGVNKLNLSQKMTFIQVFIISFVNASGSVIHIYDQWAVINTEIDRIFIIIGAYLWILAHGMPALMFMTMNKTIRNECSRMLRNSMKFILSKPCRINTSYVLRLDLKEPSELAVSHKTDILAVADGKNGLVLVDFDGKLVQHFRLPSKLGSVRGVCFHEELDQTKLVLLWLEDDSDWFISIYPCVNRQINSETIEECQACPTEEVMQAGIDMKISLLDGVVYLLGTGVNCSMIWTMDMTNFIWKTLIMERNRSSSNVSATIVPQSLFLFNKVKTQEESQKNKKEFTATYTSFDIRRLSDDQIRIVLCEAEKARLHILSISPSGDRLLETQVVKVKRSQSQKWIVQGPRLAVWDEEKIIIYDGSGKIFGFNDVDYRIQKIIADMGKEEIAALRKSNDWCFVLNKDQKCVHCFYYGSIENI